MFGGNRVTERFVAFAREVPDRDQENNQPCVQRNLICVITMRSEL